MIIFMTMMMSPQIMRLMFLVKEPTKSTSAGLWFGGPVRTRHCGLKNETSASQITLYFAYIYISLNMLRCLTAHLKFLT